MRHALSVAYSKRTVGFLLLAAAYGCGGVQATQSAAVTALAASSYSATKLVRLLIQKPAPMVALYRTAAGDSRVFYRTLLNGASNSALALDGSTVFGVKSILERYATQVDAAVSTHPQLADLWLAEEGIVDKAPTLPLVRQELTSMVSWYQAKGGAARLADNSSPTVSDEALVNIVALAFLEGLSHLPGSTLASPKTKATGLALDLFDEWDCMFCEHDFDQKHVMSGFRDPNAVDHFGQALEWDYNY